MSDTGDQPESSGFPMAVMVEGGLILVGILIAWVFNLPLREQMPADWLGLAWAIGRGLAATLPMLLVFWLLVNSQRPAWRELRKQVEWMLGELFPTASVSQFAVVALLAGVGEELLFRGVLQKLLVGWLSLAAGLTVASVLFGLAHAMSRVYFLLATLIGLYLGCLVIVYNDLVAVMFAHALYDFLALVYLARHRDSHL